MQTSVVVITRNRSDSIAQTLEALSKQECPDFEILVVDSSNGPEQERTAKRARQHGAQYIAEPRLGQSVARNTGRSRATGRIIAFTDDDCIPEKEWLARKVQALSGPSVGACTGRVVQYSCEGAADLFNEVAGQDLGGERRVFTGQDIHFDFGFLLTNVFKVFAKHMKSRAPVPFGIGHGSSMAFRRDVFDQIGGFDERFGSGAPFNGCEDLEIFYRILRSGRSIVYEPSAVVRHRHKVNAAEEVYRTRYGYSHSGAALMREYRQDPLMFFMFYGRLLQLMIKSAQYKLLGKKSLAQSFGADLHGFLDGWATHRRFSRANRGSGQ